jgi:hypothetical protein
VLRVGKRRRRDSLLHLEPPYLFFVQIIYDYSSLTRHVLPSASMLVSTSNTNNMS